MRNWYDGLICGFDLETTGLDPATDHIVQVGIDVSLGSLGSPIPGMSYEHLVNPGVKIENSDIHDITDDMVVGARTEAQAVEELVWFLRAMAVARIPVVAYNAVFDFTFSREVAGRHKIDWLSEDLIIIDPLVIDRKVDKWRKGSRRQGDVAELYEVHVDTDALHSARYDAEIAVKILRRMAAKHSTVSWATQAFTVAQAEWAVEHQRSLQAYFTKSGKTDDDGKPAVVQVGWPYYKVDLKTVPASLECFQAAHEFGM